MAALAYDAGALGEGLSVYPDGRQSKWGVRKNAELVFEHALDWVVAWGRLAVCPLGGTHGMLLMANHQWRRLKIQLPKIMDWGLTFLCATMCWVFFRADNLHDAVNVLSAMTDVSNIVLPSGGFYERHFGFLHALGIGFAPWTLHVSLKRALATLAVLLLVLRFLPNPVALVDKKFSPDWKWCVATVAGLALGVLHIAKNSPFLYFQF